MGFITMLMIIILTVTDKINNSITNNNDDNDINKQSLFYSFTVSLPYAISSSSLPLLIITHITVIIITIVFLIHTIVLFTKAATTPTKT